MHTVPTLLCKKCVYLGTCGPSQNNSTSSFTHSVSNTPHLIPSPVTHTSFSFESDCPVKSQSFPGCFTGFLLSNVPNRSNNASPISKKSIRFHGRAGRALWACGAPSGPRRAPAPQACSARLTFLHSYLGKYAWFRPVVCVYWLAPMEELTKINMVIMPVST